MWYGEVKIVLFWNFFRPCRPSKLQQNNKTNQTTQKNDWKIEKIRKSQSQFSKILIIITKIPFCVQTQRSEGLFWASLSMDVLSFCPAPYQAQSKPSPLKRSFQPQVCYVQIQIIRPLVLTLPCLTTKSTPGILCEEQLTYQEQVWGSQNGAHPSALNLSLVLTVRLRVAW